MDPLSTLGQIDFHLVTSNWSVATLFSVVDNVPTNRHLGTNKIDEHIFAILSEERKIIARNFNSVPIIEQRTTLANAGLKIKETGKMTSKTLYETGKDAKMVFRQATIVGIAKRIEIEIQAVVPAMDITRAKACYTLTLTMKVPPRGVRLPRT